MSYYKVDCWQKGGEKESESPRQRGRRGRNSQKHSANTTAEPTASAENYAFATSALFLVAKQLSIPIKHCGAIIDSGASVHFYSDRLKFKNYVLIKPQDIHIADGTTISSVGRGDIRVDPPLGAKCTTVTL